MDSASNSLTDQNTCYKLCSRNVIKKVYAVKGINSRECMTKNTIIP